MAAPVLNQGAGVSCFHAGRAQPVLTNPRVRVMGQNVVTVACLYTVSGCQLPPPPAANGPCVTANWVTAATRVRAGGQPVLLQSGQAVCTPTGTGLLVQAVQSRVRAL